MSQVSIIYQDVKFCAARFTDKNEIVFVRILDDRLIVSHTPIIT